MVSIYRRKQIRRLITLITAAFLFCLSLIIFFFLPYGLHKKQLSKVNIPNDTAMYLSLKNIDGTIDRIVNSTYAYRVSYDETLFDLSITLKSIQTFLYDLANNKNIIVGIISKYANGRNTGMLIWNKSDKNYAVDDNTFYIFDMGKIPNLIIKLFNFNDITILGKKYTITKNKNIKTVSLDSNEVASFTIYKGLLIFSKNKDNLDSLVTFFKGNAKKNDITILKNSKDNYIPDISLYINREIITSLEYNNNSFYKLIDYFSDVHSAYLSSKLLNDKILLDVYADYKYGGSDRYSLYNTDGISSSLKYFSLDNTTVFFALNSHTSSLYPLIVNDIKKKKNNPLNLSLYEHISELEKIYSLNVLVREMNNEVGFAYVKNKENNYPLLVFEITNEIQFIPFFEGVLNKKYGTVKKNDRTYKNNFIYKYDIPTIENKLYYTSKDKIFFVSENEETIETVIDNLNSKKFIDWYLTSEGLYKNPPNYILKLDFYNAKDVIKNLNMPFRTWVYPNNMIMYTWINTNNTHFKFIFEANLEPVKFE